mmetsp:Transcript_12634/g.22512  ORF Transcript_12634/g.22512 Transcript_12634/m.22512 type:complete len:235 (+) Transcript_12634:125-829(+)
MSTSKTKETGENLQQVSEDPKKELTAVEADAVAVVDEEDLPSAAPLQVAVYGDSTQSYHELGDAFLLAPVLKMLLSYTAGLFLIIIPSAFWASNGVFTYIMITSLSIYGSAWLGTTWYWLYFLRDYHLQLDVDGLVVGFRWKHVVAPLVDVRFVGFSTYLKDGYVIGFKKIQEGHRTRRGRGYIYTKGSTVVVSVKSKLIEFSCKDKNRFVRVLESLQGHRMEPEKDLSFAKHV